MSQRHTFTLKDGNEYTVGETTTEAELPAEVLEAYKVAARIIERGQQAQPCEKYARLYMTWIGAPEAERQAWLSSLRDHVRECGCRIEGQA